MSGRAKTIRIRYMWTHIFWKTEGKTSVFKNIRICVDGALDIFTSLQCKNGKEMYKEVWCTCEVVVLLIKPFVLFFGDLLVAIASLDLRPRPNLKRFMRRTKL